jgi:D-alanyl-D-alanine carboxypeptidase
MSLTPLITAKDVNAFASKTVCSTAPKREPGERSEYNNCDYFVLGAIVEKLTKKTYLDAVNERIGKPLSIRFTIGNSASNIVATIDGNAIEPPFNLAMYGASGALAGSARELAALDRALLGGSLMSADTKKIFWNGEPKLGYAALGVWSFPATIKGCKESVTLVERRGAIGGVQVRNVLIPDEGKAVVIFSNRGDLEFGEIWQGSGLMFDVLSAAVCSAK